MTAFAVKRDRSYLAQPPNGSYSTETRPVACVHCKANVVGYMMADRFFPTDKGGRGTCCSSCVTPQRKVKR